MSKWTSVGLALTLTVSGLAYVGDTVLAEESTVTIQSQHHKVSGPLISDKGTSRQALAAIGKTYQDFTQGAYWSEDMLWSIDHGLIAGFEEQGRKMLKPNDTLTEAQTLAILYRYFDQTGLQTTPPQTNWWADVPYQLAARDELQGISQYNQAKGMRRGRLATLLTSLHFKQDVDERTAVAFMYATDITSGYPDASGAIPKTYDSYEADRILQRAHIVAFIKRYHDFLSTDAASSVELNDLYVPDPSWPSWGPIKTRYGDDYNVDSQKEYDEVMAKVDRVIAENKGKYVLGDSDHEYFLRYLDGERGGVYDRENPDPEVQMLKTAENILQPLLDDGLSVSQITKAFEATRIAFKTIGGRVGSKTFEWDSAHDSMIKGIADCDADAQGLIASLHAQGYEAKMVSTSTHGWAEVKVGGKWYGVGNGGLK